MAVNASWSGVDLDGGRVGSHELIKVKSVFDGLFDLSHLLGLSEDEINDKTAQ